MEENKGNVLSDIDIWFWWDLALTLKKYERTRGGNTARHQASTMFIAYEFGERDPIVIMAAGFHDGLEMLPLEEYADYHRIILEYHPGSGWAVTFLILEVSIRPGETKRQFLRRIAKYGSLLAKRLKVYDRISNLQFPYKSFLQIARYLLDTEDILMPMCLDMDREDLHDELAYLVGKRKQNPLVYLAYLYYKAKYRILGEDD